MKRLFASLVLGAAVLSQAQTDGSIHVKSFPGNNVGDMVAAAQQTCSSNVTVPCYLILDASLAAYAPGTIPSLCAQCVLVDYRSPAAAPVHGVGVTYASTLAVLKTSAGAQAGARESYSG